MDGSEIKRPATPPGGAKRVPALPAGSGDALGQAFDLAATVNILKRRWKLVMATVALFTTICIAVVFQLTPRYAAEAAVLLDPRKTQVIDLQAVVSGLTADTAVVRSEVEVLKSPSIAEVVAKKADLASEPEFNARLAPPSPLALLLAPVQWLRAEGERLLDMAPSAAPAPADAAHAENVDIVNRLQKRTEITNDGRSYVLKIRVESETPKLAATLANAYADAYLESQLEAKFKAVQLANNWLNQHVTELKAKAETTDQAVQMFKAQHGLITTKGETVNAQQISELNSQLILAAADRAQKESNLKQLQDRLRNGGASAASQVLASPLIQRLREQESELTTREADLSTRYKPAHPAIINIKAQKRDLEIKIQGEIDKVVSGLAGEVAAARAKEASLRSSLADLQKGAVRQDQADVQLHQLEREADANRTLYQNFLGRFKQTSAQEDIQQPDARVIAVADVPSVPSYPKKAPIIGAALVGSFIMGVFAAFAVERLDNGFRTGEQVERIAQVLPLGLTPDTGRGERPHELVVTNPISPYAEAVRSIRTSLRYSAVDNPPKIVLVTSSLPDEGKTVFAISLARSVASSGGKALLIDCDLRRPSVAKLLGVEPKPGLLTLFEDGVDSKAVIQVDEKTGMHFLPARAGTTNPQDLLGSRHMKEILESFRASYDLIVLDTPPTLAVSDSVVLSHAVDSTIFLVRWSHTARPVVLGALKTFRSIGGHLAGVVLSRVDARRHAGYGYGDPGYYYGYYRKYYDSYSTSAG